MEIHELQAVAEKDPELASLWSDLVKASYRYRPLWHQKGIAQNRSQELSDPKQAEYSAFQAEFIKAKDSFLSICRSKAIVSPDFNLHACDIADQCMQEH